MSAPTAAVPYEKQFDVQATRTCGAACLHMVYRSLGMEVPQRMIWPSIAKKNQYGSIASTTHLMAADAISRGFAAVAIQARDPLRALRLCRDTGIRAILNHRLKPDSPAGHYTVLVDIDETNVTLHDPYFGPSRRVTHDVLLKLWQPSLPNSEIVGNFLIGIASDPAPTPPCEVCQTETRASIPCPRCKNAVPLQPGALLGCLNGGCDARMWNYVCCPSCDLTWNFTVKPARTPVTTVSAAPAGAATPGTPTGIPAAVSAVPQPAGSPPALAKPFDIAQIFAEVDKFSSLILSFPGAANHPDIKKQLDFIASSKDKLKQAVADTEARQKARFEQLAAVVQVSKQNQEAFKKKQEEMNKPLPPLDGDALARALLKNLGFIN